MKNSIKDKRQPHHNEMVNNDINTKTWLFVPANRIDKVAKAFASGADAVFKIVGQIVDAPVIERCRQLLS
ncbi:hypothetical protein [Psychrobacter sp. Pi2-51]|uniref:hypothetical protein n=1 Tax=Psychrobacter sp. Pi2-51 TaxID=2774132 RepID=UPI00191A5E0A|nr:hypothetical protein [Psychrobacter sp. Pi2-51]